jgi:hypothetical protein
VAEFEAGQRVEVDVTGTVTELRVGCTTPGRIVEPGETPDTFVVRTLTPFNGVRVFQLDADRLTARD